MRNGLIAPTLTEYISHRAEAEQGLAAAPERIVAVGLAQVRDPFRGLYDLEGVYALPEHVGTSEQIMEALRRDRSVDVRNAPLGHLSVDLARAWQEFAQRNGYTPGPLLGSPSRAGTIYISLWTRPTW